MYVWVCFPVILWSKWSLPVITLHLLPWAHTKNTNGCAPWHGCGVPHFHGFTATLPIVCVCVYITPSLLILIIVIQPLEFPKCSLSRWVALLRLDDDELDLGSTPVPGSAWAAPPCFGPPPTFKCAICGVGYSPMVSLLLFSLLASAWEVLWAFALNL
jgi:hypothetical protein